MNGWAQRDAERQEDEQEEICHLLNKIIQLKKVLSLTRGSIATLEEAGVFNSNYLDMKIVREMKKRIDFVI